MDWWTDLKIGAGLVAGTTVPGRWAGSPLIPHGEIHPVLVEEHDFLIGFGRGHRAIVGASPRLIRPTYAGANVGHPYRAVVGGT